MQSLFINKDGQIISCLGKTVIKNHNTIFHDYRGWFPEKKNIVHFDFSIHILRLSIKNLIQNLPCSTPKTSDACILTRI